MKRILPFVFLPFLASAGTWTVTSTGDDAADPATLRGAIAAANAQGDADNTITIALAAGSQIQQNTTATPSSATVGPLQPTVSMTIIGPTPTGPTTGFVKISGKATNGSPFLYVSDPDVSVTLKNLEIWEFRVQSGGGSSGAWKQAASGDGLRLGPTVSTAGALTIENCYLHDNWMAQPNGFGSETKADGGSVIRAEGNLEVRDTILTANRIYASAYGAGYIAALGSNIVFDNLAVTNNYIWENRTDRDYRYGQIGILGSSVSSVTIDGLLLADGFSCYGTAGIFVRSDVSGATISVKNSAFRGLYGWTDGSGGGAFGYHGVNANAFVFENCEFSGNRGQWGGAVRINADNNDASAVFANCSFLRNDGIQWGGAVDTRCPTWFVNCTAAGNISEYSNSQNSGAFASHGKAHYVLNSALAYNYSNKGSTPDDCSKASTLHLYNSFNHNGGNAPSSATSVTDYLGGGAYALFSAANETVSSFTYVTVRQNATTQTTGTTSYTGSPAMPELPAVDAASPATPRVLEIVRGGDLDATGWPVKHDADWSNIAYSTDGGATWTALRGSVAGATDSLAADSRGVAYGVSGGVPTPPIGSAAFPRFTITWDAGTTGGHLEIGGATATETSTQVARGLAPVAPALDGDPAKDNATFVGWNTDSAATVALDLASETITADTTYYAIFVEAAATDAIVSWFDEDGTTPLDPPTSVVEEGNRPSHVAPTKAADVQYTYAFAGWTLVGGDGTVYTAATIPVVSAGETLAYKAVYAATVNQYSVTFYDEDGTTVLSGPTAYDYGTAAANVVLPATPAKAADSEYAYTFAGWSPSVADVTGDAAYVATYSATEILTYVDNSMFGCKMRITVSGYDGRETLEFFPVLVRLPSTIVSQISSSADIRFADANNVLLAHEIDTWDATGESLVWVSLRSLPAGGTTFTMYWRPAASAPAAITPARVWTKAGYIGVWHMNEVSAKSTPDATGNGFTATARNTAPVLYADRTGCFGNCLKSGANDGAGLYLPDNALVPYYEAADSITNHYSAEAWIHRNGNVNNSHLFSSGTGWNVGACIGLQGYLYGNDGYTAQNNRIPSSEWAFLGATWGTRGSDFLFCGAASLNDGAGLYITENQSRTTASGGFAQFSLNSTASTDNGQNTMPGWMDEFRLRAQASSKDWTEAIYAAGKADSTFLTYGSVVKKGFCVLVR